MTDEKHRLLDQAEQLFMRYGIRSVSMDDIARELGVSKKTLYQFVENKAELVSEIMMRRMSRAQAAVHALRAQATDAMDELYQVAHYMIEQFRTFSPAVRFDLQKYYTRESRHLEQLHEKFFEQFARENLERGQAQGWYREDIDPGILAKLFVYMALSVGDIDHFPMDEYDLPQVLMQLVSYHLYGIA
ncbi:MAG: TetR/AcrR family transcriptional regulator, partial [Lewinella sp.]|nr:TetR/AcrR family transcriptional regulator [Lewinella sp.]